MNQSRALLYGLTVLVLCWMAVTQLRPHFGLFAPRYARVTVLFRGGESETVSDAKYWEDLAGRVVVTSANKRLRSEPFEVRRIDLVTTSGTTITIHR